MAVESNSPKGPHTILTQRDVCPFFLPRSKKRQRVGGTEPPVQHAAIQYTHGNTTIHIVQYSVSSVHHTVVNKSRTQSTVYCTVLYCTRKYYSIANTFKYSILYDF